MRALLSTYRGNQRGISLIEVLVGAALLLVVFSGIIAAFKMALVLTGHARAQSGGVALAQEQVEYVRSLPYVSVGTSGGIPAGNIAQNQTIMLNGVSYTRRTFIRYEDAPDDGLGVLDSNTITADYKKIKVEVSWSVRGSSRSITLVTNVIPPGIETLAGGGTLVVNVFDALALPVANAEVRVINASTSPAIDVTSYTDAAGIVMFPGAPASGGYQITATRSGYSTDQTYTASSTNPNPNPAHVAVVESLVSTVSFSIDRTSERTFLTVGAPAPDSEGDTFVDTALFASSSTNVAVLAGELVLAGSAGAYAAQGDMFSTPIAPSGLQSWTDFSWTAIVPPQTTYGVQVYAVQGGAYVLVPDTDLPSNSVGFTSSPIDLSDLSLETYPVLAFGMRLTSTDALDTPRVQEWEVSYETSPPLANVTLSLRGTKNIGTDGVGQPVRKYTREHTTNSDGSVTAYSLEWDQYEVSMDGASEGYDISDICEADSLAIAPDTIATTTLTLVPHTTRSLLVRVESITGDPLAHATASLSHGGAPTIAVTSECGYAHFASIPSSASSTLSVSASGYGTYETSGMPMNGTMKSYVILSP